MSGFAFFAADMSRCCFLVTTSYLLSLLFPGNYLLPLPLVIVSWQLPLTYSSRYCFLATTSNLLLSLLFHDNHYFLSFSSLGNSTQHILSIFFLANSYIHVYFFPLPLVRFLKYIPFVEQTGHISRISRLAVGFGLDSLYSSIADEKHVLACFTRYVVSGLLLGRWSVIDDWLCRRLFYVSSSFCCP